ncbi:MAG: hypothetical protein KAI64_04175, partial [Thermoplasmata archaeon]|nr:hypothetical protein [Thermoplasmata archaeon]
MVELIPFVMLQRGKVVKGREREVVSRTPVEYLRGIIESYDKVFILDIDGILRRKPNWSVLKKLEGKDVWVDLGLRSFDG